MQAGGTVALCAGLDTALRGGRSFPPWERTSVMLESELRFYGVFYAAYGLAVLRASREPGRDPAQLQRLAGTMLAAGAARAAGWLRVGRPHPLQQALLAVELGLPLLALLEQARHR